MHPYPYDYVISDRPDERLQKTIPLGWSGLFLSVSQAVPVRRICCGSTSWYLLGTAIASSDSGEAAKIPERTDDIYAECCHWAGRWVLVSETEVIPDASAMFACYYGDGVASNPALLTDRPPSDPTAIRAGYIIPPESGYEGVSRLLPSQVLDLNARSPKPRQIQWKSRGDYQETLIRLSRRYQSIMRGVYSANKNIWMALTGGRDSRLILSIAYAARVPATTYTYQKPWPYMAPCDRDIPPALAALAGYRHIKIRSRGLSKKRLSSFRQSIDRFSVWPGTTPFYSAAGYFDSLPSGAALIDGLCGELGRLYYSGKSLTSIGPKTPGNAVGRRRLALWWADHPTPMSDIERMYWEARLPGWAANTQRIDDFAYQGKFLPILPLNCLSAYIDILSIDEAKRVAGNHMNDLISLMLPQTNDVPINPPIPKARAYAMRSCRAVLAPYYRALAK